MKPSDRTDEPPRGFRALGALLRTVLTSVLWTLAFSYPLMVLTTWLDGWGRHEIVLPDGTRGYMWVCGFAPLVVWRTLPLYVAAFLAIGYLAARPAKSYGARWIAPAVCLPHAAWAIVTIRDMWDAVGESTAVYLWPKTCLYALFAGVAVILPYVGARLRSR